MCPVCKVSISGAGLVVLESYASKWLPGVTVLFVVEYDRSAFVGEGLLVGLLVTCVDWVFSIGVIVVVHDVGGKGVVEPCWQSL